MATFVEETPLLERSSQHSRSSLSFNDSVNANKPKLKETLSKLSRSQILCLIALAVGNFSVGSCVSLQAPFFPAQKGATASEYGFVFGVYQVSIFLFAQVYGKMIGSVPPYIISSSGVLIVGISSILFGLLDKASNESFIPLAIVIRLFEGVGSVAVKAASYAIVGVKFEQDVATVFGILETCFGVGLIIGPALGGLLFQIGGYMVPFVFVGCLLLIDSVVMFFFLPRDCGEIKKSAQLWQFWKHPPLYLNVFTILCSSLYIGVIQTCMEPHLRKFNLSPFALGCIFIICGVFYSVLAPIWGRLCDKGVNPRIFLLAGCIFGFLSPMIIGPVHFLPFDTELWMVILGIAFLGVCLSLKQVSTFILCLRHTIARGFSNDMTTYGLISTMFSTSQSIGAFVGPTAGGYLYDVIGFRWTLLIIMGNEIILIIALVTYHFWTSRQPVAERSLVNNEDVDRSETSIFESSYPKVIC